MCGQWTCSEQRRMIEMISHHAQRDHDAGGTYRHLEMFFRTGLRPYSLRLLHRQRG